jgi:hypothetical protein
MASDAKKSLQSRQEIWVETTDRVFVSGQRNEQELLIDLLLRGYVDEGYNYRYWRDKSSDENRGREALAELLRSGRPLTRDLRDTLAALFDPSENHYPGGERRLLFEVRAKKGKKKSKPPKTILHSSVAHHIYAIAKSGASIGAAVEDATQKFGLQERMIKRIWSQYRSTEEHIFGALPPPRRGRRKSG